MFKSETMFGNASIPTQVPTQEEIVPTQAAIDVPSVPPTPDEIPIQEQLPTYIDVHINSIRTGGPVLAHASVTLNGSFAIRGVKIVEGEKGPFVSMPSRKVEDGYRDICFPCTREFHEQFHATVLEAYQQELNQMVQRSQNLPEPQQAMA